MITYQAVLDVPRELAWYVSRLLAAERRRRGTRKGSRALTCFRQAVLGLRWFRHRVDAAALARDAGIPRHGKSDPPENSRWWAEEYKLTAEHFTKFIVAFCDALELEAPVFMGSSFGGNVALQLALKYPDRFAGVIPVEGADYSPGFYLDWWQHPHANAAQVCASGVWDLMAPPVAGAPAAGKRGSTTRRARRRSRAICTSTRSTTTSAASSARLMPSGVPLSCSPASTTT